MKISVFQNLFFISHSKSHKWARTIFLCLSCLVYPLSAVAENAEPFPQKMEELLGLREEATRKLILASEILDYLNRGMEELKQEIRRIQIEKKIISYTKAVQSARIRYNLLLLGQLNAYCSRLNGRIEELKAACARLDFLYQRLADDLKMVETVDQFETAGQLKQVDDIIQRDAWLNQPHLFEADGLIIPKPQEIWREFIAKK